MIFGGSPHIVEEPPRFEQKISAIMTGIGSNCNSLLWVIVIAARNKITVMLSINMDRTKARIINMIKIFVVLYLTALAMVRQSQEKNPESAIPSTMIIIPAMKMMVCQLIPFVLSVASAPARQKSTDVKD